MKPIIIISEFKDATLEQGFLSFSKNDNKFKYKFITLIASEYSSKADFFRECKILISQQPKAVIFCRYINDLTFQILENCKKNVVKTIFFIDDFLYMVPKYLNKEKYLDPSFKKNLIEITQKVNYIITSTRTLKDHIDNLNLNKNIFSMNDIRFYYNKNFRKYKRPYPVFGYMGSKSHREELEYILPAVNNLLLKNPKICFETFGVKVNFNKIDKSIHKRIKCRNPISDYDKFVNKLNNLGWWVGLAPLFGNEFNKSKTLCKWIEYTECDIPMISSNAEPYINLGNKGLVYSATSLEEWEIKTLHLLNNKYERDKYVEKSINYLERNYNLKNSSKKMEEILDII